MRIKEILHALVERKIASRIVAKDFSVWGKSAEEEASKRLGWLDVYDISTPLVDSVVALRAELLNRGVDRIVLSGMGGSSLASEVISDFFKTSLVVLDTTDPDRVIEIASESIDKTAVILSSKSGNTLEVDSHRRLCEKLFEEAGIHPAERIACITDPGSPLALLAQKRGYKLFLADTTVGGRFSALTAFGIVPAVLCGIDPLPLLKDAQDALGRLGEDQVDNPGLVLGALLAVEGKAAIVSDTLMGNWIEQLLAESTGKDLTGVLPIVMDDKLLSLDINGVSYFNVCIESEADSDSREATEESAAGHSDTAAQNIYVPAIDEKVTQESMLQKNSAEKDGSEKLIANNSGLLRQLPERLSEKFYGVVSGTLGAQFMLWEFATAVLGHILSINPFDQPDVEKAKEATRNILSQHTKSQHSASDKSATDNDVELVAAGGVADVVSARATNELNGALSNEILTDQIGDQVITDQVLSQQAVQQPYNLLEVLYDIGQSINKTGYLAIQAYLNPGKNSEEFRKTVTNLVEYMMRKYEVAVTFGWGPRFLHSTGQYHKGGPRIGTYLQLVTSSESFVEIPDLGFDFGKLIRAQAAGDSEVLQSIGRPVFTVFVKSLDDFVSRLP